MSTTISGDSSLQVINAITQFVNGTQAAWNSVTVPVPQGMVVYATDTTVVKMGDGVTLYSNLPTLFTLSSLTSLTAAITAVGTNATTALADYATVAAEITAINAAIAALQSALGSINNNTYANEINTLNTEVSTLTTDYTALQTALNALQTSVNNLSTETSPLPGEVSSLTSEYTSLRSITTSLQSSVTTLTTTLQPIPGQITTIDTEITTINSEIAVLKAADPLLYTQIMGYHSPYLENNVNELTLLQQNVTFPSNSASKTGHYRVKAYAIITGTTTDILQQNYILSLSDGTTTTQGCSKLVYSNNANTNAGVDSFFMLPSIYAPGSSYTFTLAVTTLGGGGEPGMLALVSAQLNLQVENA